MTKGRRFGYRAWIVAAMIAASFGAINAFGLRLNFTASAPTGLWYISSTPAGELHAGDVISICPPAVRVVAALYKRGVLEPGGCRKTRTTPFLKPVVAIAGDVVKVTAHGVEVDGTPLPNSQPLKNMPAWPEGVYPVPQGQVWLISSYTPGSFDSRYFGPVPVSNMRGLAKPLWVHGDVGKLTLRRREP